MEQFSLDKWLQNKSQKLVTRDGRDVRIICWDAKSSHPIVALVLTRSISQRQFDELTVSYFNDGTYYGGAQDDFLDLFFADEKEELTEFEKELVEILKSEGAPIGNIEKFTDKDKEDFHCYSKQLLDLARKELQPKFDKEMDKMLAETDKVVYQKGHEDALKDLPKWKDSWSTSDSTKPQIIGDCLVVGNNLIHISDLVNKLPKEE